MKDVGFDDEWSYVLDGGLRYHRHQLSEMKFEDGVFTAMRKWPEHVVNETAVQELNAVLDQWKGRGWDHFVEAVTSHSDYDGDTFDIRDELVDTVERSEAVRIENPVFQRFDWDTYQGLALWITQNRPYTHARITGL